MRNTFTLSDEGVSDSIVVVSVTGDLDLWNAPALEQRLRRCLDEGQCWIVVDLTHAAFLDSSGLGALTNSMRRIQRKGGRLVVINTNEQMRRVFELTGLVRVLNVVPDRARAMAFIDEQRDGDQP
ncbi:MAG TPA: STAS domain-containing protein [Solirubrobacteraceae bacterium]|nr:STAS domain-containing protein [Solirubrobacteraceae bacterium]